MVIDIHGHRFKVEFVDGEIDKMNPKDETCYVGLTEYLTPIISIRRGLDEITTRETVIHELVHAFIYAYGYSINDDEAVCNFFGVQGDSIIRLADEIMGGWNKNG